MTSDEEILKEVVKRENILGHNLLTPLNSWLMDSARLDDRFNILDKLYPIWNSMLKNSPGEPELSKLIKELGE